MSRQRPHRQQRRDGLRDLPVTAFDAQLEAEAAAARKASRRFARATSRDASTWGGELDVAVLRRLQDEAIAGLGRVVYSSNAVFLAELAGPDPTHPEQPLRAIYKPARGERPLWDFPRHTLHLREVAAYIVSAALGDGIVPPTALRDGPHGPGSVQLFVHGAGEPVEREGLGEQLHALAALDVLINNADRKRAHLLLGDDGRLHGIDNALSFLPYPRQRTVLIELGGRRLPAVVAGRVEALATDASRRGRLRDALARLLDADEVEAFDDRLDGLAASRSYPRLDPWEGRPFEWW